MSLFNTPELRQFRQAVRDFLADELPHDMREQTRAGLHLSRELVARWQATLHRRGWGAPRVWRECGPAGPAVAMKSATPPA